MRERKELSVLDYAVFFGSLVAALGIGVWQAVKFRKDSQREMLVISKGMNIIPITLSLIATYLSAILILGTPAEVYANGSEWFSVILGFMCGIPLACVTFVPIFYKLKLTSVNEYFELRFRSKGIRILGSVLFLVQNLLYMGVALWAPVIAISSVTSMPEWLAILAAGGICTIYTAIGGLRAVVWTDAFQVVVMLLGLLVIIIYGSVNVGGIGEVWRIAAENGRASFFNMSFNPFERHAFIWIMLQTTIGWMLVHGANQSSVQRYSSCKTLNQARLTLLLNIPGVCFLVALACFAGVVLFANYKDCDPLKAGVIKSKDQIIPYFVLDKLGTWQGLPGLFMACLFSGALSTLSSGLNSLAAITWEDGIKQCKFGENLKEFHAGLITKILGVVYGVISIGLAFVAGKFGGVLQVVITVTSILASPSLNLFLSSVLLPFVNVAGVTSGCAVSLGISAFLGFGSYIDGVPPPKPLPSSIEGCPAEWELPSSSLILNATSLILGNDGGGNGTSFAAAAAAAAANVTAALVTDAESPVEDWDSLGFRKIFRISYLLFMCAGLFCGLVVTVVVSLATGGYPDEHVDSSLVHGWSINLFRRLRGLGPAATPSSSASSVPRLVTSASSYDVELSSSYNSKMGGGGLSSAASKSTLVTTLGEVATSDDCQQNVTPLEGGKYSRSNYY